MFKYIENTQNHEIIMVYLLYTYINMYIKIQQSVFNKR